MDANILIDLVEAERVHLEGVTAKCVHRLHCYQLAKSFNPVSYMAVSQKRVEDRKSFLIPVSYWAIPKI